MLKMKRQGIKEIKLFIIINEIFIKSIIHLYLEINYKNVVNSLWSIIAID